jgi:two-component system, OmpR family, response regulator
MNERVLVIDDDYRLFALLKDYFSAHGMQAFHAPDGLAGLSALKSDVFDAVLLDVMMPGMEGLETLRKLRANSQIPVIMLTARGDETDRVVGLELGADDYVPKPFGPRELLARVRALLRRTHPAELGPTLRIDQLVVDVAARQVSNHGQNVDLTGLEFDLLVALMERAGRVVPRGTLFELAGRQDTTVGERTIDVHISRLRRKLGDDPPTLIRTVRGAGYLLSKGST